MNISNAPAGAPKSIGILLYGRAHCLEDTEFNSNVHSYPLSSKSWNCFLATSSQNFYMIKLHYTNWNLEHLRGIVTINVRCAWYLMKSTIALAARFTSKIAPEQSEQKISKRLQIVENSTKFTLKTHATGIYVASLKSTPLILVTIRNFS